MEKYEIVETNMHRVVLFTWLVDTKKEAEEILLENAFKHPDRWYSVEKVEV